MPLIPKIKIHGVKQRVASGYVAARVARGKGDLQLIPMQYFGALLSKTGSVQGGHTMSVGNLLDVNLTGGITDGQTLVYDAASGTWIPTTISTTSTVSGATDTNITSPDNGQILVYDFATNMWVNSYPFVFMQKDCGDETTAITASTGKSTFRIPHDMTLSEVRASLTTAQATDGAGGIFTVDVMQNGSTIFSTLLTIDNTEKTSVTAATPAVLTTTELTDDDEMRIDVTQIGDGTAAGLKVTLIGIAGILPANDNAYFGKSYFGLSYFGIYA